MNTYNITVKQGSTYRLIITIKDPDGVPIDLTGYEFRGQIRKTTSDSTIQAQFSFDLKPQENSTLGQVEAIIYPSETSNIQVSRQTNPHRKLDTMVYDIESENTGTGEVVRWLEGQAFISPEVTR